MAKKHAMIVITGGTDIVGHLATLDDFSRGSAARVLVGGYARATGLDVDVSEASVVEVRALQQTARAPRRYELRVAGATVATARTV